MPCGGPQRGWHNGNLGLRRRRAHASGRISRHADLNGLTARPPRLDRPRPRDPCALRSAAPSTRPAGGMWWYRYRARRPGDLAPPVPRVRGSTGVVVGASVPVAAIDEHGDAGFAQDKVRCAGEPRTPCNERTSVSPCSDSYVSSRINGDPSLGGRRRLIANCCSILRRGLGRKQAQHRVQGIGATTTVLAQAVRYLDPR